MKKIIMIMALVLASCNYSYKVPIDTDTIKYVIEYPAADIVQTSASIIEITEEPTVLSITPSSCPSIKGFLTSEIFLSTYCNEAQKENYTCCQLAYDEEKKQCMIYLCHTNVVENYDVSCLGFSEECY